jgi:hypothetical protein
MNIRFMMMNDGKQTDPCTVNVDHHAIPVQHLYFLACFGEGTFE